MTAATTDFLWRISPACSRQWAWQQFEVPIGPPAHAPPRARGISERPGYFRARPSRGKSWTTGTSPTASPRTPRGRPSQGFSRPQGARKGVPLPRNVGGVPGGAGGGGPRNVGGVPGGAGGGGPATSGEYPAEPGEGGPQRRGRTRRSRGRGARNVGGVPGGAGGGGPATSGEYRG